MRYTLSNEVFDAHPGLPHWKRREAMAQFNVILTAQLVYVMAIMAIFYILDSMYLHEFTQALLCTALLVSYYPILWIVRLFKNTCVFRNLMYGKMSRHVLHNPDRDRGIYHAIADTHVFYDRLTILGVAVGLIVVANIVVRLVGWL